MDSLGEGMWIPQRPESFARSGKLPLINYAVHRRSFMQNISRTYIHQLRAVIRLGSGPANDRSAFLQTHSYIPPSHPPQRQPINKWIMQRGRGFKTVDLWSRRPATGPHSGTLIGPVPPSARNE
ncbi:hypothetical protein CBL_06118 [Carabus blaptoides fortunei]